MQVQPPTYHPRSSYQQGDIKADDEERKSILEALPHAAGTPDGLESLYYASAVYIEREHQMTEPLPLEITENFDNRYAVYDHTGQCIYYIGEKRQRTLFNGHSFRPFLLHILDTRTFMEVVRVERPSSCALTCWGGDAAGNNMIITHVPTQALLGQVVQRHGWCCCCRNKVKFDVIDRFGIGEFTLTGHWSKAAGSCCTCYYQKPPYMDVEFNSYTKHGEVLDSFLIYDMKRPEHGELGMPFPPGIDCHMKSVLMAFLLNVYITYFEDNQLVYCRIGQRKCQRGYAGRIGISGCGFFLLLISIIAFLAIIACALALTFRSKQ